MDNINKVYKRDHNENIKFFRDLKSQNKFSLYNAELNRVFGDNTYDKFYKDLLGHKKIHINNFKKMFEKPIVKGGIKKIDAPFNIEKFIKGLKNMKLKQKKLEYKLKHPLISKNSLLKEYNNQLKKSQSTKDKIYLPDIPDIGMYNPNYNAVRTHSFYPVISSYNFEDFKKYKKDYYAHQLFLSNNKDNESSNQNIQNINENKNKNLNKSKSNILSFKTEPSKIIEEKNQNNIKKNDSNISQNLSTSSLGEEKKNHCLKLKSSSPKKPIVSRVLNESKMISKTSANSPRGDIRGNFDFNKIYSTSHLFSYFDEIIKNSNNPPIGMYQPNYNSISKKPVVNIYINKKGPISHKIAKLKKIIYNYNASSKLEMIPTSKINNKRKLNLDKTK